MSDGTSHPKSSTPHDLGNIEDFLTRDGADDYQAFLERLEEILEDCNDSGVLNIKEQLLAEVRTYESETSDVIDMVRISRQFEDRLRIYSYAGVLVGQTAKNVGENLTRITSAAALESAFRQQGLNEGEIAVALQLLTTEPLDPILLEFLLTKRHNIKICNLSTFGVWVTWTTPERPNDPYATTRTNSQFVTLAGEVGLYPPPQPNEDWLLLTYLKTNKFDVLYPRIFDAAASAPPWNPYYTSSKLADQHGWARDAMTSSLLRPEGVHCALPADTITTSAKKFEL